MKLNAPAGTTHVFDDLGQVIPVTNGQVDVEPHMVPVLINQGFTIAGPDNVVSDTQAPVADGVSQE